MKLIIEYDENADKEMLEGIKLNLLRDIPVDMGSHVIKDVVVVE